MNYSHTHYGDLDEQYLLQMVGDYAGTNLL